jgi:general secretion pathway protein D
MQYLKKLSLVLCLMTVLAGCANGRTAFDKGEKFESAGDLDQAVLKYAEAATANPEIKEYRLRFLMASEQASRVHIDRADIFLAGKKYDDALREYQTAFTLDQSQARAKQQMNIVAKLRSSQAFLKEGEEFEKGHKNREALRSYQKALEFSSASKEAKEGIERMLKTTKPKFDGYELNLKSKKPITLKFKDAKIKDVFNIITQLSGINFIFDEGVKDINFSIYLENATFYQALDVITELNKLGKKVLNETTIIIYPKNQEKSKQYEDLYLQTFYLNKIDAKKAVNLLRTMMQIKKIYVNEELNAIIIRDTPAVVELAGKILEANDMPDAEVVLEVEVIELTKSNADNLGLLLSKYAIATQGLNNGTAFSDSLSTTTASSGTTTTTKLSLSNTNSTSSSNTNGVYFKPAAIDLLSYKGLTITLQFRATTDVSLSTFFRIDDVSLQITTGAGGDITAPTTSVTAPANGATSPDCGNRLMKSGTVRVAPTHGQNSSMLPVSPS